MLAPSWGAPIFEGWASSWRRWVAGQKTLAIGLERVCLQSIGGLKAHRPCPAPATMSFVGGCPCVRLKLASSQWHPWPPHQNRCSNWLFERQVWHCFEPRWPFEGTPSSHCFAVLAAIAPRSDQGCGRLWKFGPGACPSKAALAIARLFQMHLRPSMCCL